MHLSDLHFTGRVGKAFFQEVVDLTNELEPDLVAITGDLVDTNACIDWMPDTLGQLTARHGVYFVLGNHDLTGRHARGCGGRWSTRAWSTWAAAGCESRSNGAPIVLAGNELPWFPPAADMRDAPPRGPTAGRCGSSSPTAPTSSTGPWRTTST